jgi:hypothetical protein
MIDYAVLKHELRTDPLTLNYDAMAAKGDHQGIADALNLVRDKIIVDRKNVLAHEVFGAINMTDYFLLPEERKQWLKLLVCVAGIEFTEATVKAKLYEVFPEKTETGKALRKLLVKRGSRCEQLFGSDVRVFHSDIARALQS